jgi:hypothetical protein
MVSMSNDLKERHLLKLILIVRFACATLDLGHPIIAVWLLFLIAVQFLLLIAVWLLLVIVIWLLLLVDVRILPDRCLASTSGCCSISPCSCYSISAGWCCSASPSGCCSIYVFWAWYRDVEKKRRAVMAPRCSEALHKLSAPVRFRCARNQFASRVPG